MKINRFMGATALASATLLSIPAFAQVAAPPTEQPKTAEEKPSDEVDIVVTGSRIARPTLDSSVPITSVGPEELLTSGDQSLGDALNDLPSLRSTFSSSNSTRFIGTVGLNFLDLRGLGTERTLTLVDGRRHVPAGAGGFSIDINTIPSDLVSRVDIVTGGNSAVYGSDAIAGVINFVMKKDFDGITARGQGSISDRGDRGAYFVAVTAGKNFGDGRGNIAGAVEYSKINPILNRQRPNQSGAFIGRRGFTPTDRTRGEAPAGDGIPDQTFETGQRLGFISDGGTVSGFCLAPIFETDPSDQPAGCQPNGLDRLYRFNPQGRLVDAATPIRELRGIDGSTQLGGDGSTLAENGTLFPELERMSASIFARYDVSDAFKPFFEFKFSRLKAAFEGAPSFFNSSCDGADPDLGQILGIGGAENNCSSSQTSNAFVSYDNAFLNPADAAAIRNVNNEFLGFFGIDPISQGFFLNRNNEDFGGRGERLKRDTYRAVAGFGGSFNDDWNYEIAGTYGKFKGSAVSTKNLVTQRFRNAVDSVRLGNGNIVCRINSDVSTANDDAACVPINIFGNGSPSAAALNYVLTNSFSKEEASQLDLTAFVKGDMSQLFELPGGPISFVLGGEYRRERSSSSFDAFTASGATFLNSIPAFAPPTYSVREAFGEMVFPILKDTKLANELTLTFAGRISDYNKGAGLTGTTKTYNAGLIYSPISDIRLRANYSRSVRAPTPGDLFVKPSQTFLFLDDPCDDSNISSGSPTRLANCRANGVPEGYVQSAGSKSVLQGGNPALAAEISNSLTFGVVLQPRFVKGLTVTVDYYDIKVKNLIAVLGADSVLRNCYDAPDLNNRFCAQINQRQSSGQFNTGSALLVLTRNFAQLRAKGIDTEIRYERKFDNGDRLDIRAIGTYVLNRTDFLDPDNPTAPDRVKSELGDPAFSANFSASYQRGPVTFGYDLRYIGRQVIGEYEDYFAYNGNPPRNADRTAEKFYTDVFYHDVRLDYEINNKLNVYFGVDNLGDRLPPSGLSGIGGFSGIYDNVGRVFYAGARIQY